MPFLPIQPGVAALDTPAFTASPVERTHNAWMFLWPFHSFKALVANLWLLGGLASSYVLLAALWLGFPALALALPGVVVSLFWIGPYRALPARMTIITRNEPHPMLADVQRFLARAGYRVDGQASAVGHAHFRHKICDAAKGYLNLNGEDVELRWGEHSIELYGPIVTVKRLRRLLVNPSTPIKEAIRLQLQFIAGMLLSVPFFLLMYTLLHRLPWFCDTPLRVFIVPLAPIFMLVSIWFGLGLWRDRANLTLK